MTREDLLAALDLAPEPQGPIDLDEGPGASPGPAGPPPSPTALELDDWSLRRGAETLAESELLKKIFDKGLIPPEIETREALAASGRKAELRQKAELIAADCLAAAFEPTPQLAERCTDETRGRYFRQLLETEEYAALHAETRLDAVASELAAGHFAQGLLALAEKMPPPPPPRPEGSPPPTPKEKAEAAREEMKRDLAALSAAAGALDAATTDVDELRDAQRSLGGDGGVDGQRCDPAALKARFDRIKKSRQLRRIMELAGRYRRLAQAKQRQKTKHGQDDVVGVELGADLGRLLPSELAALADDDLQWDAMRRYLERGLLQRDYRGVEPVGRGPIVVVVDESGSMSGDPIAMAKAFSLAMGWVAKHQRRWICFVGFSGKCPINALAMPPGRWDQGALVDWLEHFYGGGNDRDVPLVELPEVWPTLGCPAGQTDVIQITDAYCDIPPKVAAGFLDWKSRTQAKYYTLVLGHDDPGDLRQVSDRVWCLPDLSIERDAIQDLMSI